ncbi:MBL fold metallo-hydrolase [Glutamicibacter uratoxydans]|uniref:MBL fold metallo-hydrolase n=1 Tax=Glutamicibacter uratoxydans TaxID=43667 RepID=UPI003D6F16DC
MITPVSAREFAAHANRQVPEAEEITEGIWSLPLANKPGHMPFTFSYLIRDAGGDVHLLDSGWDLEPNMELVDERLKFLGASDGPASITITHLHPDHLGLARNLRARYGTPVSMHRIEDEAQLVYARWNQDASLVRPDLQAWGVPEERFGQVLNFAIGTPRVVVPADQLLEESYYLPVVGRRLRVLHTPGHTPGHISLYEEDQKLLFSGDQLLPKVTPGIGAGIDPSVNPLEQYLNSLEKLTDLSVRQCLPGHEYRFEGAAHRAAAIAARHLQRTAEVASVLETDPTASVWRVASQLSWGRGWQALDRHYLVSALRQTAMHMRLVLDGAHLKALQSWTRP